MNLSRLVVGAALLAAPIGAGCDGASSAREPATQSPKAASALAPQAPTQATLAPVAPAPSAGAAASPQGQPGASIALKADPSAPKRDSAGILEASFDDVKFNMDPTALFEPSMLTPRVKELSGDRIRIRGYMYPTLRKNGLKQFVLVRDNMVCCFGPGAALYDCILVTMDEGKATEYVSTRPVAVEGKFRYEEPKGPDGKPLRAPDGRPLAIYQMIGEAVK